MNFLVSYKTTLAGVAAILAALADFSAQLATGGLDGTRLMADLTGVATGAGLIFAKDSDVTGGKVKQ